MYDGVLVGVSTNQTKPNQTKPSQTNPPLSSQSWGYANVSEHPSSDIGT
jgi:hypothetical protein